MQRIQSVDRAMQLLWVIRELPDQTLTELSAAVDLLPSTVARLLVTLEGHGMVERMPKTRGYRLGTGLLHLSAGVTSGADLVARLEPMVRRLAGEVGERVDLSVLEDASIVHILSVDGAAEVGEEIVLGPPRRREHGYLHATALGKVFLAAAPEVEANRLIAGLAMERRASRTITDKDALRAHLVQVRRRGYALSLDENSDVVRGVAAPIRDATGAVVAGIGVHGPAIRFAKERLTSLAGRTRAAAEECSKLLGFVPPAGVSTQRTRSRRGAEQ